MSESIQDYHKQGYIWVSIALAIPVFLWPVFLLLGFTPAFGISIEQNWLVSACSLLMAVVVADSILSYQQHHISHVISGAIWIIVTSSVVSLAIRNPDMIWFIAALFALRPLHIIQQLWRTKHESLQWWQWIAWWRDTSTALIMFLWLSYWPQ